MATCGNTSGPSDVTAVEVAGRLARIVSFLELMVVRTATAENGAALSIWICPRNPKDTPENKSAAPMYREPRAGSVRVSDDMPAPKRLVRVKVISIGASFGFAILN